MGESANIHVEEIKFFSDSDSEEESKSDTVNCFYSITHIDRVFNLNLKKRSCSLYGFCFYTTQHELMKHGYGH